jgi:tRNA nucleotidyltransferase (CCA-adding enzyme)
VSEPPGATTDERPPDLRIAPIALAVLERLWAEGHAAVVVGGAVRDLLLGLPIVDWDVATDARPERVLAIFPDGVYENRFGTVSVGDVQITTFRRDHRYADHRRPESVTFTEDAFEDLARRDLTINAIAWGRIRPGSRARAVDPADGMSDLRSGIVRAVGDPDARFDEDALRMLRAVRIAAQLGFTVEPRTRHAIGVHSPDVAWVSEERTSHEVRLMLVSPHPVEAIRLLRDTGILGVILPELATRLADDADAETWLEMLARVTAAAPGDERLALAGLVADLGGECPGGGTDVPSPIDPRDAVLARLRVAQRDAAAIARIVEAAREPYASAWSDADVRRHLARTRPELAIDALILRSALAASGGSEAVALAAELRARSEVELAARRPLALADLAIDGDVLREALGLPEGPAIGELLARSLEAVIEEPSRNDRATLVGLARDWHGAAIG